MKTLSVFLIVALIESCTSSTSPNSPGSGVTPLPPDNGVYATTYYVDSSAPVDGDGLTSSTPKQTLVGLLTAHPYPGPSTKIAFKRGTVTRLTATLPLRGGTSAGWVCWGAYGDPSLPKPILIGSVAISWTGSGTLKADWSGQIDTGEGRTASGIEQGPGNLWFFDGSDNRTGNGWRKPTNSLSNSNDWYYDPAAKTIYLKATLTPFLTEASVNRTGLSFAGQSYLIVEDLDLRYFGGYALKGNEASHLRFRNLDFSYIGGGTKVGQFIRLGNGIETNGNTNDVIVENCRFDQIFDTAFDPQDVGTPAVIQQNLVYRNNIVMNMGLAGVELWMRTTAGGSQLNNISITSNTFAKTGYGWGFVQHDQTGMSQVGADVVIFQNTATASGISVTNNTFAGSKMVLMSEFKPSEPGSQALVRGMTLDYNLWSSPSAIPVVLFTGTVAPTGVATPNPSDLVDTLAHWQANLQVPGKDQHTTIGSAAALPVERSSITRFGPFPLDP